MEEITSLNYKTLYTATVPFGVKIHISTNAYTHLCLDKNPDRISLKFHQVFFFSQWQIKCDMQILFQFCLSMFSIFLRKGVLLWLGRLRIQHCHCSSPGCCCGAVRSLDQQLPHVQGMAKTNKRTTITKAEHITFCNKTKSKKERGHTTFSKMVSRLHFCLSPDTQHTLSFDSSHCAAVGFSGEQSDPSFLI